MARRCSARFPSFFWALPLLLLLFYALVVSACRAEAQEASVSFPNDTYFFYVSESGSWSYTDEVKRVPSKYIEKSQRLSWEALRELTDPRWTPAGKNVSKTTPKLPYLPDFNPNRLRRCDGHASVTTMRIQEGSYNREVYVVTDSCGDVVLVSPYPPTPFVSR